MKPEEKWLERMGLIAALVEKAPGQTLGRTAIMKLAYFLQVLKKAPLGYRFGLEIYGPFDSDVLDDLRYARFFGAVKERTVTQAQGYRFEIKPGKRCAEVQKAAKAWLDQNQDALDWVVQEFGALKAPDLELWSTIIFVDRDNHQQGKSVSLDELAKQVRGIKPRFSQQYIVGKCREARDKGYLQAVSMSEE
ncbi:MAG: hypothetical protein U0793_17785 [Gemmataceae bacterium]